MTEDEYNLVTFQLTPSRRATLNRWSWNSPFHFNSRPHGGRPETLVRLKT